MGRHETPPTGVLSDHFAQFLFGRTHVDNNLFVGTVERLDRQQRNGTDRRGQHHQIDLRNRFFQRLEAIHQTQRKRLVAIGFGLIHSDQLGSHSLIPQAQGERSPDQPYTYDRHFDSFIVFHLFPL